MNGGFITNVKVVGNHEKPPTNFMVLPSGTKVVRFQVAETKSNNKINTWDCVAYGYMADIINQLNLQFDDYLDIRFTLDQESYKSNKDSSWVHRVVLSINDAAKTHSQTQPKQVVTTPPAQAQQNQQKATMTTINLEVDDPFINQTPTFI